MQSNAMVVLMCFVSVLLTSLSIVSCVNLYLTYHGGSGGLNNIDVFAIGTNQVQPEGHALNPNGNLPHGARGLVFAPNGNMYLADASDGDSNLSSIMLYSSCGTDGIRNYLFNFTANLDHPYGVAIGLYGGEYAVFASNQDTYQVTAYSLNGTYLGLVYDLGQDNVRGIAYDALNQILYIADEDASIVYGYSVKTNSLDPNFQVSMDSPVGVYTNGQFLFVGTKSGNYVNAYSLQAGNAFYRTFNSSDLSHAAGIASYDDQLFVISQNNNQVLEFSISTGDYFGIVISNLQDTPEQIAISPC